MRSLLYPGYGDVTRILFGKLVKSIKKNVLF